MKVEIVDLARRCAEGPDSPDWFRFHRMIERRLGCWIRFHLTQGRGETTAADDTVEDLVQEVFVRLVDSHCRALRRCRAASDAELMAYLRQICASVVTDRWRRDRAQKRDMPTDARIQAEIGPRCEGSADPRDDPELKAIWSQLRRCLFRHVEDVFSGPHARRDREIFELAVLGGWSSREIASSRVPALSTAAIDTVVSRTRRRLEQRGLVVPSR